MTIIRPITICKFVKKDGTERRMTFISARDMTSDEVTKRVKGTGVARSLPSGMETVWDLNEGQWRTVNRATFISNLTVMAEVVL
jgi:hypothetical protein